MITKNSYFYIFAEIKNKATNPAGFDQEKNLFPDNLWFVGCRCI